MGTFRYRPLAAALGAAAVFFGLRAMWIPAKAELAQFLMEGAWRRYLAGAEAPRPWPWADTHPVAELVIPRLGLRQLVLDGASGRNLAFGPAALTSVDDRDLVLSGHRDTSFAALRDIGPGDRILLTRRSGVSRYRVAWLDVIDTRTEDLVLSPDTDRLTLVTCYPFDALTAGGPLRLVVTAVPEGG